MQEWEALLRTEHYQGARAVAMTTFEKGLQQGLQGWRRALKKQLEGRFGPLSPGAEQRLESLNPERLEALTLELPTRNRSRNGAWRIEGLFQKPRPGAIGCSRGRVSPPGRGRRHTTPPSDHRQPPKSRPPGRAAPPAGRPIPARRPTDGRAMSVGSRTGGGQGSPEQDGRIGRPREARTTVNKADVPVFARHSRSVRRRPRFPVDHPISPHHPGDSARGGHQPTCTQSERAATSSGRFS